MNPFKIKIIVLVTVCALAGCDFNRVFLRPDKFPDPMRRMVWRTPKDTVVITFSGTGFQPAFIKNNGDTLPFPYTIESVIFKSGSGNTLNGWMMKAKNKAAGVTLLHCHGNAGSLMSQFQAMTPLLKNNFQIFMFDYSGFGHSTGRATKNNILKDANAALDYLKTRPDVAGTKLVVYGQSLGGHLATILASRRQGEIDGLVAEGAFSSHRDIAAFAARDMFVPGFIARSLVKKNYSAKEEIAGFHKPLLVIHSTEDDVVPYRLGKKLYDCANAPKEFYEILKCHICGPRHYGDEISARIHRMIMSR